MVNEEILGGLKLALERGESLKKAMMTFFNSGYKKEEISEAARLLENYHPEIQPSSQPASPLNASKPAQPIQQPYQPQPFQPPQQFPQQAPPFFPQQPAGQMPQPFPQQPYQQPFPQQYPQQQQYQQYPQQGVSSYGESDKKNKVVVFLLIFLLVFLIGLLVTIFLFREDLVNFFSGLFGD